MKTVRLTMAQALVRYLMRPAHRRSTARRCRCFAGVFAIFGHGNVTCLGEALEAVQDVLPTWRGQNEQSMALAAVAYAKAKRRRQIMVAASLDRPGRAQHGHRGGGGAFNRLPVLLLAGDTFANRMPDPVLQQVEHFGNPDHDGQRRLQGGDPLLGPDQPARADHLVASPGGRDDARPRPIAARPSSRWRRMRRPKPTTTRWSSSRPRCIACRGRGPTPTATSRRRSSLRKAKKPLIISGGGVHYSLATRRSRPSPTSTRCPSPRRSTAAPRSSTSIRENVGPIGVIGSSSANALAAEADVVLAVGTRLQDFITGSWTVFAGDARLIALNAARFDAIKHRALSVVGDALVGLEELSEALTDWRAPESWAKRGTTEYATWNALVDKHSGPTNEEVPSYAHVVGAINRICDPTDLALTAAGGLPGELCKNWRAKSVGTFDCEFGFSCMGYEISGALGRQDGGAGRATSSP